MEDCRGLGFPSPRIKCCLFFDGNIDGSLVHVIDIGDAGR